MHASLYEEAATPTGGHALWLDEQGQGDLVLPPPQETHKVAWIVAGVFALAAVLLSLDLIRKHLKHFAVPLIQSKHVAVYLDLWRDCYEAYVIYLFLSLMIAYLGNGDEEKVVEMLGTLPPIVHPFPFSLCCSLLPTDRRFLKHCKWAAMQFVLLKPLTALIAVVLELTHNYSTGYWVLTLIMNISISYAFYYLVLFYIAFSGPLAPFHPVPKFLCIKAVLFLSFWQGVLLGVLSKLGILQEAEDWSKHDISTAIQNLLICIEMFLAALAHRVAFPYYPFVGRKTKRGSLLSDNLGLHSAVVDFNEVMPIVLPSGFQPQAQTFTRDGEDYEIVLKGYQPEAASLRKPLLEEGDGGEKEDKGGWRL